MLLLVLAWSVATLEHRYLYHPNTGRYLGDSVEVVPSDFPFRGKLQNVFFTTKDGYKINGWFFPPSSEKPTVVFAQGNGGNMGTRIYLMAPFLKRGYGFLAFDYRGYGNSGGTPSEQGLYQDMRAASRYLAEKQHIPYENQIAMGESLGGAVAIDAATGIPYKAVFVYSTFTSIRDMADHMKATGQLGIEGLLPLQWLITQEYDSIGKIPAIRSPLLVAHSENDTMIPASHAKRLYAAAATPCKQLVVTPQGGHNAYGHDPEGMIDALEALMNGTVPGCGVVPRQADPVPVKTPVQ